MPDTHQHIPAEQGNCIPIFQSLHLVLIPEVKLISILKYPSPVNSCSHFKPCLNVKTGHNLIHHGFNELTQVQLLRKANWLCGHLELPHSLCHGCIFLRDG